MASVLTNFWRAFGLLARQPSIALDGENDDDDQLMRRYIDTTDADAEEELYTSVAVRGAASRAVANRGIRLLVVPARGRSGLLFANMLRLDPVLS